MSNEQDKKTNPNPEELEEMEDKKLDTVAGGVVWYESYKEGLSTPVQWLVEDTADEFIRDGKDRTDCAAYIQMHLYDRMCKINEAEGYEYNIDWMYINHILDEKFGCY